MIDYVTMYTALVKAGKITLDKVPEKYRFLVGVQLCGKGGSK